MSPEYYLESLDAIEKYAKEDTVEFYNLINLFDGLEEDNAYKLHKKMRLAEILANLKHEPIKEFLLRILHLPKNETPIPKSPGEINNRRNQIDAATNLIKLEDIRGKSFLENFVQNSDKNEKILILRGLYDAVSVLGFSFLLELADQDEYFSSNVNREICENNLKALSKIQKKK